MDLSEALTVRANADAALEVLVGESIHWVTRPQKETLPALVMQVISDPDDQDLDGETGMREARVQLDGFALSYLPARAVANAAIAALLPEDSVGDIVFGRARADGPRDLGEQTDNGFIHRANVDLIIRYSRV